jgi:carboxyl-terminal processing protease
MPTDRTTLLRLLAAAATVLVLVGAYRLAMREESMPSGRDVGELSVFEGVWRSRGYGMLWAVEGGRLQAYDESGSYCIRSGKAQELSHFADGLRISDDRRTFRIALDDPTYEFAFDRIEALPDACTRKPAAGPVAVLDAIEQIFTAHYAFFRERNIDWPKIVHAARAKVDADTSEAALLDVVRSLLSHFPDDHVSLRARVGNKRIVVNTGEGTVLKGIAAQARAEGVEFNDLIEHWKATVWGRRTGTELLGDSARSGGNGNIKYGLIGGDIGYLGVLSMVGFAEGDQDEGVALDAVLDDAMALFANAKAVIVDVSLNDGGHDRLARLIAARFADKETLAYSKYAGDAPGSAPQAVHVVPSGRPRYAGPVYLVTSNVTVSAAEIFTMAMRALPNVTHVGEATRGSLSDVLTKRLPNGWSVTLSNEVYLDAAGKAWEGAGIPPKVNIAVFRDGEHAASYVQAIGAVADCIRRKGCPGA